MEVAPIITSGPIPDDRKNHFLSTPVIEPTSARPRSNSHSPSLRSFRSSTTEVYNEPVPKPVHKEGKSKRITTTVEIELSFWDCLKGLNPLRKKARTVPVTVEVIDEGDDMDSDEYEIERPSPFIQSVFVLSNEKDRDNRFIQKRAQCTIDTGNHQGNIVSKNFLVNELKFPESAFMGKGLRKSEMGGVSVTGHILMPEGTIRLDWYHAKSTQRYRQMRFLVSPNPRCDLIIGARSIEKHGILAPPNLGNSVVFNGGTDSNYQKRRQLVAKLENDLNSLQADLKDAKKENNETEIKSLDTKIELKKKELEFPKLALDLYVAQQILGKDQTSQEQQDEVNRLQEKYDAAKELLPKSPALEKTIPAPPTDPKRKIRTSTGSSIGFSLTNRTKSNPPK